MADFDNSAVTYKCPGCAGNLFYNADLNKLSCKFCGSDYNPDVLEILEAFNKVAHEEDAAEDDGKHEIVCGSCGATVITDENTASAICCFCGSPALSPRRLTKEFRPDYLIPFKVTREEAKKLFIDWAANNKYIPDDFTSEENINKLTGLYVPFWLVDCKCYADFYGTGYINQGDSRAVFALDREVEFYVQRVPFDGSKEISNRLMAAVEPFDYSEMVEYKDSYLPGFYAERYNQTPLELSEGVSNRMKNYAEETVKILSCGQYDEVRFNTGFSNASEFKHSYALLPVWFMNYQYEGINYGFAINGQTGEACGDLPYSKAKRRKSLIKTTLLNLVLPTIPALLLFLSYFISLIMLSTARNSNGYAKAFFKSGSGDVYMELAPYLSFAGVLLFVFIFARFRKRWIKVSNESQNPIDPPPHVEEYYDALKKPVINKVDKFVSMQKRNQEGTGSMLINGAYKRGMRS